MKRNHVHLLVDVLLAVTALGMVWTGLLLAFVLPPGSRATRVWGLERHDWGDVHFWMAMGIVALVLVHVALNWRWVWCVVVKLFTDNPNRIPPWKIYTVGIGLVLLLTLFIGSILWAAVASRGPLERERQHRHRTTVQVDVCVPAAHQLRTSTS